MIYDLFRGVSYLVSENTQQRHDIFSWELRNYIPRYLIYKVPGKHLGSTWQRELCRDVASDHIIVY